MWLDGHISIYLFSIPSVHSPSRPACPWPPSSLSSRCHWGRSAWWPANFATYQSRTHKLHSAAPLLFQVPGHWCSMNYSPTLLVHFFLSQWILKESKRKDLLVGHKESMFLAKWVQYCADPKVVLVRPSSIKLLPCWPLYCQLKHQHRTQTNKTQKHETQVERSYVLSRGASTRSLVDTSSSCADLAGDVLHLVLGLLQLAPHPRHLAHQPPVVSLRLLPQLDSSTI